MVKLGCLVAAWVVLFAPGARAATVVVSVPYAQAHEVPSTVGTVNAVFPAGARLEVSDDAAGGWRRVRLNDGTLAFVSDTQVRLLTPAEIAPPVSAPGAPRPPVSVRKGTRELRLDNAAGFGFSIGGNGFLHEAPDHASNSNLFSVSVGLGYFVTDNFELGGGLSYLSLSSDSSEPSASVFGRGYKMISPTAAAYLGASAAVILVNSSSSSDESQALLVGPDAGVELFVTDTWAVRVGASYRRLWASSSMSGLGSENIVDLTWGLAAYF
jgi:hypothetical protein